MKKNNSTNNKAIAILRVSSAKQKDGISHSAQEQAILDHCVEHDLKLEKTFKIVESASSSQNRKQYSEAIREAVKNKIGNVLFYMLDRETRNLKDLEENENLVRRGVFAIHYVRDNLILNQESSDSDFLLRDITGAVNKNHIRNLKTKVVDAMTRKAQLGWYPSNNVPLGYMNTNENEFGEKVRRGGIVKLDDNLNNRKVVLREFELRAQGLSFEAIRDQIRTENLLTPKKSLSYKAGAIERRIKNPFYRGRFYWRGELYKGKHELFIPQDLIKKIDAIEGRGSFLRRDLDEYTAITGGWLKCACGCNIVYDPKEKIKKATGEKIRYHYYHCTNGKEAHETMKGMTINHQDIWTQFGGIMEQIEITEDFAQDIANALNEVESKAHGTTSKQIDLFKAKLEELDLRQDSFVNLLADGTIDKQTYKRNAEKIIEERSHLILQLEQLQKGLTSAVLDSAKTVLELAKSMKSIWKGMTIQERKEALDYVVSNPILNGVNIQFNLRKPFGVLIEMKQKEKWCDRKDSNLRPLGSKPSTLSS